MKRLICALFGHPAYYRDAGWRCARCHSRIPFGL